MLLQAWLNLLWPFRPIAFPQQHTMGFIATAKRCAQNNHRSQCRICRKRPGYKHTCEFCPNWYCYECADPKKHQCASLPQPGMSTTSKASSPAHIPKRDGKQRKAPPTPKPPPHGSPSRTLHILHQGTGPNMGGKAKHECEFCRYLFSPTRAGPLRHVCREYIDRALGPPIVRALATGSVTTTSSAPSPAHEATASSSTGPHKAQATERKALRRSAASAGEGSKQPSHRQDTSAASKKSGTATLPREWTRSDSDDDTWGPWGPRPKCRSAPKAQPATKADKAARTVPDTDDEDSELELTITYRVKKKVALAVTSTIEAGYALDYHNSTRGLAQTSPSTALKILESLRTATYANPQQHLDRCIKEAIATHMSTQPLEPPQPRCAQHSYWTAQLITRQLEKWASSPSTLPPGLHTYGQGRFRIDEIMGCWGTREGLTTTEVIAAIKAHCMGRGRSMFALSTESHYTLLAVGKVTPIGQAEQQVHTTITKHKSLKTKKRHLTSHQQRR